MHNLWPVPRATGVRQIHNLHPELAATRAERKNAAAWLAIKVALLRLITTQITGTVHVQLKAGIATCLTSPGVTRQKRALL